jgi:hypothetical protein
VRVSGQVRSKRLHIAGRLLLLTLGLHTQARRSPAGAGFWGESADNQSALIVGWWLLNACEFGARLRGSERGINEFNLVVFEPDRFLERGAF